MPAASIASRLAADEAVFSALPQPPAAIVAEG
jgi:hypothetical protein